MRAACQRHAWGPSTSQDPWSASYVVICRLLSEPTFRARFAKAGRYSSATATQKLSADLKCKQGENREERVQTDAKSDEKLQCGMGTYSKQPLPPRHIHEAAQM